MTKGRSKRRGQVFLLLTVGWSMGLVGLGQGETPPGFQPPAFQPPVSQALFNGQSLEGWTPKFVDHPLGVNYKETFQIREGLLTVDYSHYTHFRGSEGRLMVGHLFYEKPFSHYRLTVTYRFVGEQVPGGPAWAFRNSGILIHCQTPSTMGRSQDFPKGIEVQLLGTTPTAQKKRTTLNLCTPSTHVRYQGQVVTKHVIASPLESAPGDEWMTVQVEVRGSFIRHLDEVGNVVLEYQALNEDKTPLESGYLALQAESHPVQFQQIRWSPLPIQREEERRFR